MANRHPYRPYWAVTPLDVFDYSREQLKQLFGDSPETLDYIVRAVNAHEELVFACKAALERWGNKPGTAEIGEPNKVGDILLKAIAKAEGRTE